MAELCSATIEAAQTEEYASQVLEFL
jgi:hypothetical protein